MKKIIGYLLNIILINLLLSQTLTSQTMSNNKLLENYLIIDKFIDSCEMNHTEKVYVRFDKKHTHINGNFNLVISIDLLNQFDEIIKYIDKSKKRYNYWGRVAIFKIYSSVYLNLLEKHKLPKLRKTLVNRCLNLAVSVYGLPTLFSFDREDFDANAEIVIKDLLTSKRNDIEVQIEIERCRYYVSILKINVPDTSDITNLYYKNLAKEKIQEIRSKNQNFQQWADSLRNIQYEKCEKLDTFDIAIAKRAVSLVGILRLYNFIPILKKMYIDSTFNQIKPDISRELARLQDRDFEEKELKRIEQEFKNDIIIPYINELLYIETPKSLLLISKFLLTDKLIHCGFSIDETYVNFGYFILCILMDRIENFPFKRITGSQAGKLDKNGFINIIKDINLCDFKSHYPPDVLEKSSQWMRTNINNYKIRRKSYKNIYEVECN